MTAPAVEPGGVFEAALWFDPSQDAAEALAKEAIRRALAAHAARANTVAGPPRWEVLAPGDRRLPDPPPHLPRGVKCLVGRCTVTARAPQPSARRFALELDPRDLDRFRAITRREWAARQPNDPPLSDAECDDWIERYGPAAAANVVRRAYNADAVR
jgi:hypothetical protein